MCTCAPPARSTRRTLTPAPPPRPRGASVRAGDGGNRLGVVVSGGWTPHYLTRPDDLVLPHDNPLKINPPLRTETDRQALVDALRSGVIDCIATDHAPHARHEKEVPFEQAPMGTTGLETAFAALYTELVLPGEIELDVVVERMSAGAALYDLRPPRIAGGEPAELCPV